MKIRKIKRETVNLASLAHVAQDHKKLMVAVKTELYNNLKRKPKFVLCVRELSLTPR